MTLEKARPGRLDGPAVALFWGSVLAGVLLPALSMWVAERRPAFEVLADYWLSFTGADPGLVFITALHAVPFVAFGAFCLLHLGKAPVGDRSGAARRLGGTVAGALLIVAVSLWGNIAIFSSRSSTASLGFIVLPFYLLLAGALGYGLGRIIVRFARR